MITLEKLDAVKGVVDKLMTQGQMLYDDITETAKDRARLLSEVTEHEQTIDKLNGEIADLQARNRDLELRNSRLVDDLMKCETQYLCDGPPGFVVRIMREMRCRRFSSLRSRPAMPTI